MNDGLHPDLFSMHILTSDNAAAYVRDDEMQQEHAEKKNENYSKLLKKDQLNTQTGKKKLRPLRIGPFEIVQKGSPVIYRLDNSRLVSH